MWTKANRCKYMRGKYTRGKYTRGKYTRDSLRYPGDVKDTEWELVAPLIPPARRV